MKLWTILMIGMIVMAIYTASHKNWIGLTVSILLFLALSFVWIQSKRNFTNKERY